MFNIPATGEIVHGLMMPREDCADRDHALDICTRLAGAYHKPFLYLIESEPDYWIFAITNEAHPPGTEVSECLPIYYIVYPPAVKSERYEYYIRQRAERSAALRTELALDAATE